MSTLQNILLVVWEGYDTKALRTIISLRKKDRDQIAEEEVVLDMYKEALGMS